MIATKKTKGKSRLEQLKKGIKTEKEHKDLYLKIKKRLEEKAIQMPISEKEFYTEIAKTHLKERKDYYDLLEKYVEKYSDKNFLVGGELTTQAIQIAMDEVNTWSDAKVAEYLGIPENEVDIDRRMDAVDKKSEELTVLWSEMKKGGGEIKESEEYAHGGQPRPSPSESATSFPVGYQKKGNNENWWEVIADYRGVQRWKRIQEWEVKEQYKSIVQPKVEEIKLTDLQEKLLAKGFINEDLSLTNKGKRIIELHKYCFPMDVHPFSHIYYDINDLFPTNSKVSYVSIGGIVLYTGTEKIFESGENLPDEIKNLAVQNTVLDGQISLTKSDRIEFRAYSYCPGIEVDGKTDKIETQVGYIVFNNFVNNNELYISSPVYNYAMKNYDINMWQADSSNALLLYGLKDNTLKVVIRVDQQVIGLYNTFSLFDREKVLSVLKTKYANLFFQGKTVTQAETVSTPEIVVEIEQKKPSEERLKAIAGLEVMLELADSEEEKQQYLAEIEKLKK